MALLFGDQGEGIVADMIVNYGTYSPQTLTLKLYKNNYTPVDGSTEANFTEATFTGYSAATMTPASWTITPGAPTLASYPQVDFTCTGAMAPAENVYGYYVVRSGDGKYMWGELFFDGPYPISKVDDVIHVTATFNIKKTGE